ncbi:endonuclease [Photobacterium leiognathi]|uniref:endonuclease n=1 Tax=Photobacterium leiognathi TaxID=553611 RepID=UPI0029817BC3|nr:endonuclease [Photobacterium leiognathi]
MKANIKVITLSIITALSAFNANAFPSGTGNTVNQSFSKAKKIMQHDIYTTPALMKTLYCHADFNERKQITLPSGFVNEVWKKRAHRWEAEHITPAESFGRTFSEWRDGSPECVNSHGKHYKGRRCANKASAEYRYMQSDLWNLAPAIGSVNAAHSNYRWSMLPDVKSRFGSCDFRYDRKARRAQPPMDSRGIIGRTELYMAYAYPRYKLSSAQRKLFEAWNKQVPVNQWECTRAYKIYHIQGNKNPFVMNQCQSLGLFHS